MRSLLFFFPALLFCTAQLKAQEKVPSAADVLQPVYAKAAKENKKVMVIFHASWCGWCRKMDASLQDKTVKPLIDKNYEIAHLTVYESADKKALENPGALELLTKHGGNDQGLPYWLVLDKDGQLLAGSQITPNENSGCPATEPEVDYFIGVLKKTSPLTKKELDIIKKRFRKNEL